MRLLNVTTMKLEEYFGSGIPEYAILSHCWGLEEVTFVDINRPNWRGMHGAAKIESASSCCQQEGLNHIWIDTCCIDKSSSAELSEAINSMYNWYEKSRVCFAYLEDVNSNGEGNYDDAIRKSRWFTRGWTLQELIAPKLIHFFNMHWIFLGEKSGLSTLLSGITTIPEDVLAKPSRRSLCSVARKMSWAATRKTTREEDIAYCLLGIFDVRMPLLYGEGSRAFIRLQEEILKETDDQSLFAWGLKLPPVVFRKPVGVLAVDPSAFAESAMVVSFPCEPNRQPYSMTNRGLRIELPVLRHNSSSYFDPPTSVAMLDCHYENDFSGAIGISLEETSRSIFTRMFTSAVRQYSAEQMAQAKIRTIYIAKQPPESNQVLVRKCLVRSHWIEDLGYKIIHVGPRDFQWNPATKVLDMNAKTSPYVSPFAHFVFSNDLTKNCFAINLCVYPPLYHSSLWQSSIGIEPKPEGVDMDSWLKECEKRFAQSTYSKTHDEVQIPNTFDEKTPLTVRATVAEEEILNQKIVVLDIRIKRPVVQLWF